MAAPRSFRLMSAARNAAVAFRVLAFGALAFGALAFGASAVAVAEAPRRIVSFNLCADQLVLALADPDQVVGLSPYAADPLVSVVAERARAFPRLDWQAETTIALSPDLVLVGPIDRPSTRRMLRAQGVRVIEVELITDIDAARAQITRIAGILGHPQRGERLVAALDAARARLAAARGARERTALALERNGYAAGPASLVAALLAEAGLRSPPGGPTGYGGFISLEQLVVLRPDVLVLEEPDLKPIDQGALFLTHPALAALYAPSRRLGMPRRFTLCGGPALVAALEHLATVLSGVDRTTHAP